MRTKHIVWLLMSITLIMASCKKKEITQSTTTGNPPFYFNGTINGVQTNIQAGVNDYYMFTGYTTDANSVYNYTGEFRGSTCTSNCPNSLKIYIKDYRTSTATPTAIDSTITIGYYSYATPAGMASMYSVQYVDSLYNATALSYSWNFGDNTLSTQHKPTHTYLHPGTYYVSLNTQSTAACSSSVTDEVVFGEVGNLVQLSFAPSAVGDTISVACTVGGVNPLTFNWNFGDGTTASSAAPVYKHGYAGPGVYQVTLSRADGADSIETSSKNFPIKPISTCYTNFTHNTITPLANPINLADVVLEWHDASGNLYTSYNNSQPNKSMFKITSVADYQTNSNGEPTKIIHAKVYCTLYNGANSMVLSGDVSFSVAYL